MNTTRTESTDTIETTVYHIITTHIPSGEVVSDERFADTALEEVWQIAAERDTYDDILREVVFSTTYQTINSTTIRGTIKTF